MGGASSRPEIKKADSMGIVKPLLDKVQSEMETTVGAGFSWNMFEMGMSVIKSMDNAVKQFIHQSEQRILKENFDILNAYYDASQKARDAAEAIRKHARLSMSQLKRLAIAVQIYQKGAEDTYGPVLEGLKAVVVENIGLPDELVKKLEEARDAYVKVIVICENSATNLKHMREEATRIMWTAVAICGMIGLGVVLCAVAPPIGGLVSAIGVAVGVSISTTAATTFSVAVGGTALVLGAALTVPMTVQINEILRLVRQMEKQKELLSTAEFKAQSIVGKMKHLKDKISDLQGTLEEMADSTSTARLGLRYMEQMCEDLDFGAQLDKLPAELQSLCNTCDELCNMVDEAYNFFEQKSGFIIQRITSGLDLH